MCACQSWVSSVPSIASCPFFGARAAAGHKGTRELMHTFTSGIYRSIKHPACHGLFLPSVLKEIGGSLLNLSIAFSPGLHTSPGICVHLEHCHQAYRSRRRFARLEKCCCAASCRYVVRRYDCLHLSFPIYFISFWGQSMIQFPCQTLEGIKRFALFWLVAKLASGCSPGTCLCATGFPLHTEAVHPDAGLQQQVG